MEIKTGFFSLLIIGLLSNFAQTKDCIFGDTGDCYLPCNCQDTDQCIGGCQSGGCSLYKPHNNRWTRPNCLHGNIALGKTANQSGDYQHQQYSFSATKAIDGSTHSPSNCSYSVATSNDRAWWTLDLKSRNVIQSIRVYAFSYGTEIQNATEALTNFNVTVGNTSNIQDHDSCQFVNFQVSGTSSISCSAYPVARYVSISKVSGSTYQTLLPICEVEVYGHPILDIDLLKCTQSISGLNGYKVWCKTCAPGWRAPDCKRPCENTLYGENCVKPCRCLNNTRCDSVSGVCPGECEQWYIKPQGTCDVYIDKINNSRIPTVFSTSSHVTVKVRVYMYNIPSQLTNYYQYHLEYDTSPSFSSKETVIVNHTSNSYETGTLKSLKPLTTYYIQVAIYRVHRSLNENGTPSKVQSFRTLCRTDGYYGDSCNKPCNCENNDICNHDNGQCPNNCQLWYTNTTVGGPCKTNIPLVNNPRQISQKEQNHSAIHLRLSQNGFNNNLRDYYLADIRYSECDSSLQYNPLTAKQLFTGKFTQSYFDLVINNLKPFTYYCIYSALNRTMYGQLESGTPRFIAIRTRCLPPPTPSFQYEIWDKQSVYIYWGYIVKSGSGCQGAILSSAELYYRRKTQFNNGSWINHRIDIKRNGTALVHLKGDDIYQFKFIVYNNDGQKTDSEIVEIKISEPYSQNEIIFMTVAITFAVFVVFSLGILLAKWIRSRPGSNSQVKKTRAEDINTEQPSTNQGNDGAYMKLEKRNTESGTGTYTTAQYPQSTSGEYEETSFHQAVGRVSQQHNYENVKVGDHHKETLYENNVSSNHNNPKVASTSKVKPVLSSTTQKPGPYNPKPVLSSKPQVSNKPKFAQKSNQKGKKIREVQNITDQHYENIHMGKSHLL